jgi:Baseplate J-like protein
VKTLAKLLYVEADEEITDLVDRLRDLSLEDEVTFVVPERARALQSPMSFRLLKRYADSYGKRVNLVSADPRLQAMSLESGFTAYPTLAAYDSGTEVHSPEPVGELAPAAPAVATGGQAVAPQRGVATLDRPRETAVLSPAKPKTPPPSKPGSPVPSLQSYRPYLIGAGVLAILVLLVGILYVPSVTATISVSGTPVKEDITLLGAPGTAAGSADHFTTQPFHAEQTQSIPGTATGQKQVPAQPSTGSVTFSYNCVLFCDNQSRSIPAGTTVSTNDAKHFTTQKTISVGSPRGAASVQVQAVVAGPSGNVDQHSINVIDNNRDFNLSVDNGAATSGGADPRTATVIQQSDIDSVRDVYAKDAIPQVTDQLNTKAQGLKLVLVGSGVQASATADHKVGEEVTGFTIAAKVAGDGVAFDDKAIKQMLKSALQLKIPQGSQMAGTGTFTYDAIDATADGHITLNGHASGFYTPVFLETAIRSHLKGLSPSKARAFLQSLPNVVDARVTQSPFGLPWLPFFSSRITLKIQEVSSSSSSP